MSAALSLEKQRVDGDDVDFFSITGVVGIVAYSS